ncbi:hypothetical protein FQZ97_910460 [compost metagenome]
MYGVLKPYVAVHVAEAERVATIAAETAIDMWSILQRNWKVGYWSDDDARRRTQNEFDDYLYDVVKGEKALPLTTGEMDAIMEDAMQLARHRMVG